jgi:hypothetical protein
MLSRLTQNQKLAVGVAAAIGGVLVYRRWNSARAAAAHPATYVRRGGSMADPAAPPSVARGEFYSGTGVTSTSVPYSSAGAGTGTGTPLEPGVRRRFDTAEEYAASNVGPQPRAVEMPAPARAPAPAPAPAIGERLGRAKDVAAKHAEAASDDLSRARMEAGAALGAHAKQAKRDVKQLRSEISGALRGERVDTAILHETPLAGRTVEDDPARAVRTSPAREVGKRGTM